MEALAQSQVKNITFSAKIIRANGDVEDLGVIAEHKFDLISRALNFIKKIAS